MTKRLGVLLSGGGRTLENLAERIARGELEAEIACVLSNKPDAFGLVRAQRLRIPHAVETSRGDVAEFSRRVFAKLREHRADLVVMAGFLVLLAVPTDFAGRVLNIHPSLIPAFCGKGFYGDRVHAAVLQRGCKVSGATVHFVDDQYDHGPILLQQSVPVQDGDDVHTLAERVFAVECELYPRAIALVLQGRVRIEGRRAVVLDDAAT